MTTEDLMVKMVMDRWNGSIGSMNKILNAITDEQLQKEIVPGKNRGIYLLGHLIAVHDEMLILLDLGEKLYPELFEPFIKNPDKMATNIPTVNELKSMWERQNAYMKEKFEKIRTKDWFTKHSAVNEQDFAIEPHRNKLNIIISRTSHLQYHTGQMVLLN